MQAAIIYFITVIAILLPALYYLFKHFAERDAISTHPLVLLLGTCESGKTSCFYALKEGSFRDTVSSMKINSSIVNVNNLGVTPNAENQENESDKKKRGEKRIELVDVPGHPRLRRQAFSNYLNKKKQPKSRVSKIVYFVDCSNIDDPKAKSQSAEFLYEILTDAFVIERRIPILVACNKSDLAVYLKNYVKKNFEVEIEKIRLTRSQENLNLLSESMEGDGLSEHFFFILLESTSLLNLQKSSNKRNSFSH